MSTTSTSSAPMLTISEGTKNTGAATNFFGFKGRERNASVDSSGATDFTAESSVEDKPRLSDIQRNSQSGRPSLTPPNKSMFSFFGTTKPAQNELEGQEQRKSNDETLLIDTDQAEFDAFVSSVTETESADNSPSFISPRKSEYEQNTPGKQSQPVMNHYS